MSTGNTRIVMNITVLNQNGDDNYRMSLEEGVKFAMNKCFGSGMFFYINSQPFTPKAVSVSDPLYDETMRDFADAVSRAEGVVSVDEDGLEFRSVNVTATGVLQGGR